MRWLLNIFSRLLGGDDKPGGTGQKSRLMGMYLSEANESSRTQFELGKNRERQHGKSFSNRERA
ncbi:MAG: hypothetical protein ACPGVU_06695 [Limisphaerales bacterium]